MSHKGGKESVEVINLNFNLLKLKGGGKEKMRNIKRTVVVGMLMIVLLATTVTGCGSNGNINPTSKPTETTQTENASSTPSEKVKIEYWHVFSENMGAPSVQELVEKFNQQHKDIENGLIDILILLVF
ncbi:hypothetical protein TKV_c04280 [Thermoanaerobacter kivui]|uniref:Uncharacterized protein n=1 Tax=Thermoanaerobacter kivui TaxID=2325 RepID=A0A097AP99_THEKI|nr:hypothetical protein [Thermoanaerobacter kivui]AIS51630.1 hypothetical protein TKV_c04280 [Thermoanaerobacter kivui]